MNPAPRQMKRLDMDSMLRMLDLDDLLFMM